MNYMKRSTHICEHVDRPVKSRGLCSPCYQKKRYHDNPDRARAHALRYYHKDGKGRASQNIRYRFKRYGITHEEWLTMWAAQGGLCYICKTQLDTGQGFASIAHLDHCHATDKIRKILCGRCNTGLGSFRDDPTMLRRAADYIEEHQAEHAMGGTAKNPASSQSTPSYW